VDGGSLNLADYRGKVVLLYFWATWCSPCVASTPRLKEFYEELSVHDNFVMISLSMDFNVEMARSHVKDNNLMWPQAYIGPSWQSSVAKAYGIGGIPAYILIDSDGRIAPVDGDLEEAVMAATSSKG